MINVYVRSLSAVVVGFRCPKIPISFNRMLGEPNELTLSVASNARLLYAGPLDTADVSMIIDVSAGTA